MNIILNTILKSRKRRLIALAILIIILGGFAFASFVLRNDAEADWSPNHGLWAKRKRIPLVNNSSDSLATNTTVAVTVNTKDLVNTGKLQSDCDDLRVLYQPNSTDATELDRFISYPGGGSCSTSEATKVYFKLQSAISSSAISNDYYMYYKNDQATAPSNSDNAFDIGANNAILVCPFDGTTTCAAGETPTTATGAIRYSGSKSALSFQAGQSSPTHDYATVSGDLGTNLTQITIEAWVNQIDNLTNVPGIISRDTRGNCTYSSGLYQNFGLGITFDLDIGGSCRTTGDYDIGSGWHHVAGVYDGSSMKLYVDGVIQKSVAVSGTFSAGGSNWRIGDTGFWNQGWTGYIDEVRVSDIARYSSNFSPSTSPFVRDENTKLLLHFDENGDDPRNTGKAIDDSGNGNHATLGADTSVGIDDPMYVTGFIGVDASTSETGNAGGGNMYAGHEGIFFEAGTTNKITNPSFENSTYDTNWTASASATLTANTLAPFYKFGSNSAKAVVSGADASLLTSINVGNTNRHTLSAYVFDGTTNSIGGQVTSSVAQLMFNATPVTTTYSDMGGGWWRLSAAATGINASTTYGVTVKDTKTLYVDAVQLEQADPTSNYATSYTDGSLGTGYAWSGTENNSTSTRTTSEVSYVSALSGSDTTGSVSVWYKPNFNEATSPLDGYDRYAAFQIGNGGWGWGNGIIVGTYSDTWQPATSVTFSAQAFGTGTTGANVDVSLTINNWYHIVYVWNGTTHTLYVNNASSGAQTFNTHTDTGNLYIGSPPTGSSPYSTISDLRVYDSALSSAEAADLYYSGLVSHLDNSEVDRFSGDKGQDPVGIYHFDEGYGTTAQDSSLFNNDLTLYGPTWETQSEGAGAQLIRNLKFDGTNDIASGSAQITKEYNFGTESFSISGWFRHSSDISGTDTIIAKYGSAGYKVYMDSSGYLCFGIDDDSTFDDDLPCSGAGSGSFADSRWHHFEAVKDGTTSIKLYVDGNEVASDSTLAATGSLNNNSGLFIGADSNNSNYWSGNLDEIIIYPYARSLAQVKEDRAGGQTGQVFGTRTEDFLTEGLVGYWKMNETSAGTGAISRADSSGNGNTLIDNSPYAASGNGKFGNSTQFVSANSEYLSISDNASLSTGNIDFTICTWVFLDTKSANMQIVSKREGTNSSKEFEFGYSLAADRLFMLYGDGTGGDDGDVIAADALGSPSTATWYYLCGWHNTAANLIGITVNGSLTNSMTPTSNPNDTASTFRVAANSTGNYLNGKVDELRMYKRLLSLSEVSQLYNWAPGPVGYWKFDEGSGTSIADSSGNGYTGTTTGDPVWDQGKFGGSLRYDGTDDRVDMTDVLNMSANTGFTLEAWVKRTGNAAFNNPMAVITNKNAGSAANAGYEFKIESTSNCDWAGSDGDYVCLHITDGTDTYTMVTTSGTITADSNWHHVAATIDRSNENNSLIFIDGVQQAVSRTGTFSSVGALDSSSPLCVGKKGGAISCDPGSNNNFVGNIDEVKIYNYARTSGQIVEDMNAGHPAPGSPVGSPTLYWTMDQGTDNTCGSNKDICNSGSGGSTLNADNTNASWSNSGKYGKAIYINNNSDYLSAGDVSFVDGLTAMTVSFWVNPDSLTSARYYIGKWPSTANSNSFRIGAVGTGNDELQINIASSTTDTANYYTTSNLDLTTSAWQLVTIVYDGSLAAADRIKVYKNTNRMSGSVTGTIPTSMTSGSTSNLNLGDITIQSAAQLAKYDEVKIYASALTADQVKLEYNQSSTAVWGATSTTSAGVADSSSEREYCIPGDSSTCNSPFWEMKLDEGNGTTFYDTSGNGRTASWIDRLNGASVEEFRTGKKGKGYYQMADSADYSYIETTGTATPPTQVSMDAWIYPTATHTNATYDITRLASATGYQLSLEGSSSPLNLRFRAFWTTNGTWTANSVVPINQWTHVAVSYDAGSTSNVPNIYVNGILQTLSSSTAPTGTWTSTADNLNIFTCSNCNVPFLGIIDNVVWYNYIRTSAQVVWSYNRGAPVAYWAFDECSGANAYNTTLKSDPRAAELYTGTVTEPGGGSNNAGVGTCSVSAATIRNGGASGKRNASLEFDGTDDYVTIGDPADGGFDFDANTSFSYSAWFNPDVLDATGRRVLSKRNGTTSAAIGYDLISGGSVTTITAELSDTSIERVLESTTSMSTGNWYFATVVVNRDTDIAYLYVNGKQENSLTIATLGTLVNSNDLMIGRISGSTSYFNGKIDEVRIYNYALTTQQVRDAYNDGAVRFGQ